MEGFEIKYRDKNGKVEETFMGSPMSSFDISHMSAEDQKNLVLLFFGQAHPGCKVISIKASEIAV